MITGFKARFDGVAFQWSGWRGSNNGFVEIEEVEDSKEGISNREATKNVSVEAMVSDC